MEGVILYADDHVFDVERLENKLFKRFNTDKKFSVLPINNLTILEKTVSSISTFKALILDWNFKRENENEDDDDSIVLPDDDPYSFLKDNSIYSLIYIYSQENISEDIKDELKALYPDKIFFESKNPANEVEDEYKKIIAGIEKFEKANNHLIVPFIWSKTINEAVQKIFSSLNAVDRNWITELYNSAKKDGVNPSIEVINMFQNILSEKVIQSSKLKDSIDKVGNNGSSLNDPIHYTQLMRILYYGTTQLQDPIMTGDIFKYPGSDKYCIIVTPECDLRHISKEPAIRSYEVLVFSKGDYKKGSFKLKANIKAKPLIDKAESFKLCSFSKDQKTQISQELNQQINKADQFLQIEAFTQTNSRFHLLPCFEFEKNDYSGVAVIDFRFALSTELGNSFLIENRVNKLNTPYIQELRQRYLSYKGRVGVAGYSDALKEWILKAH